MIHQLAVSAEEGELQHGTDFQERVHHQLKHNVGLSRPQMVAIERRLQVCVWAIRLGELRDWRRLTLIRACKQLCATAERLISLEWKAEPTEIAQRVQQARDV